MQCFHCGRQVRDTTHWQKGYRVDYYRLHTGTTEWDYLVSHKENAPPSRYLRLTNPVDILTCVRCYELPEIRQKLDDDFRGIASLVDAMREPMKPRTTAKAD